VRNNFAPVSKEIGAALHYDKSMIGDIWPGLPWLMVWKIRHGLLRRPQRCRKYVAFGLLLTAAINFIFGATGSYWGHVFCGR